MNKFLSINNGKIYLILGVLIFAASASIIQKLTEIGSENLIDGRNPISFCNVLFVGNIVALILMIIINQQQLNFRYFRQISLQNFLNLNIVAIFEVALAPTLFFSALAMTMVNNVILIGRIEPPLSLALAILFLKEKVNYQVILGALISFLGVFLTILLQPNQNQIMEMTKITINQGDIYAFGAAICLSVGITISKVSLADIPLGIFTIYKTLFGTIVFFIITITLYGFEHFMDVSSPLLWQWMLLYGTVIVVGGQVLWLLGLKKTTASEVSLVSSFSPILGIIFAYFILNEVPTTAQYIGGGVIFLGIIISEIPFQKLVKKQPSLKKSRVLTSEIDHNCFKGL